MKLQGSLACLLLALCLGRGAAGPLQGGGESTGHGVGEVYGHPGIEDQRDGEAASRIRELGETFNHGLEGAAHALENTGNEAGRLVENGIRHGVDAARSSEAWGTSGGHGMLGHSQGNLGGPGSPWGQGYPGGSEGSFGTNSLGGSSGQGGSGGSLNFGTNAQGAVAQPGYGSVRGSNQNSGCTNPPPSGSGGSSSNSGESSSSQGSGGGSSQGSGGSSSHGGSHGGSSSSHGGSHGGSSSSHGGSHGGGSSGGSSSGNSGSGSGSSSGASRERPLENSRDLDQSFSVSKGSDSGPSSGSSSGSSGGNKPECDSPGNEARLAPGGSGSQESRENSHLLGGSNHQGQGSSGDSGRGDAVSGLNTVNSQTSPGLFNFDTFWKNFKSKLGFINWDAIEKGRVPSPSTRALLYFRRLWENFKHKTPFFNWKEITEDADMSTLQKRAGGADQFSQPGSGRQEVPAVTSKNYNYNQQAYPTAYHGQFLVKTPAKGGVTISSSASRVQPGLLQWVKFW